MTSREAGSAGAANAVWRSARSHWRRSTIASSSSRISSPISGSDGHADAANPSPGEVRTLHALRDLLVLVDELRLRDSRWICQENSASICPWSHPSQHRRRSIRTAARSSAPSTRSATCGRSSCCASCSSGSSFQRHPGRSGDLPQRPRSPFGPARGTRRRSHRPLSRAGRPCASRVSANGEGVGLLPLLVTLKTWGRAPHLGARRFVSPSANPARMCDSNSGLRAANRYSPTNSSPRLGAGLVPGAGRRHGPRLLPAEQGQACATSPPTRTARGSRSASSRSRRRSAQSLLRHRRAGAVRQTGHHLEVRGHGCGVDHERLVGLGDQRSARGGELRVVGPAARSSEPHESITVSRPTPGRLGDRRQIDLLAGLVLLQLSMLAWAATQ